MLKSKFPLKIFYKYNVPIGRKLFNYNTFLKSLDKVKINEIINSDCHCQDSSFIYAPLNHVVSGDLSIVQNVDLQTMMRCGVKYREPVFVEPLNLKQVLFDHLDNFVQQKCNKYNLDIELMNFWLSKVKEILLNRIKFHVTHNHPFFKNVKSIFSDIEVKKHINYLQNRFIITVADKASNNFVFICKKFYTLVLLRELGIDTTNLNCSGNNTYSFIDDDKQNIITKIKNQLFNLFNIMCSDDNLKIPNIFWNPKLHKTPYKPRFIAGARKSCNKQLEKLMNKGLFLLKTHFSSYCSTIYHRTGINCN